MRIEFEERDRQWIVTVIKSNGASAPGEPFPAFGGESFSKLEQVLYRIKELGYAPTRIPYNRVDATRYAIEVKPI